jgi:hypothetical protein
MTTVILTLALLALLGGLVSYVRHDRFAGPASRQSTHDEVGRSDPTRLAF